MVKVMVVAEVRPSEDVNKVLSAISNFFDFEKTNTRKEGIIDILVLEARTLKS